MQQLRNNARPPVSRHSLPVPLLSRVFLIYQQLSFPSRPFSRRTLFRVRFMKWYFVHSLILAYASIYSPRLGSERHLISKVSRNSYSIGNNPIGCLKNLTFVCKSIVILFRISNFPSYVFHFSLNYGEEN